MDKKITIVIPYLNEKTEILETIKSIYKTIDISDFSIIAIDDCSKETIDLKQFKNVKSIRNAQRMGVDGCRQMGVDLSETDYVLILDAHMRFKQDNWASKMIKYIDENPRTLWCTVCLGLGYGTLDVNNHKGKYFGADIKLYTPKEKDRPCRQIIEPVWASEKEDREYLIQCILGANYFFNKRWFTYIGGLRGLKSWGTSEPWLSIKSYLAGGDCKITKEIEIGHLFRDNAPYSTVIADLVYNKLYVLKTIFPKEIEDKLMVHVPKDVSFRVATKDIEKDKIKIAIDKEYYQKIFKSSIYDLCQRFDIKLPE